MLRITVLKNVKKTLRPDQHRLKNRYVIKTKEADTKFKLLNPDNESAAEQGFLRSGQVEKYEKADIPKVKLLTPTFDRVHLEKTPNLKSAIHSKHEFLGKENRSLDVSDFPLFDTLSNDEPWTKLPSIKSSDSILKSKIPNKTYRTSGNVKYVFKDSKDRGNMHDKFSLAAVQTKPSERDWDRGPTLPLAGLLNLDDNSLPDIPEGLVSRTQDSLNPLDLYPQKFSPGLIEKNEVKDGLKRHWFKIDRKLTQELYEKQVELENKDSRKEVKISTSDEHATVYQKQVDPFSTKFEKHEQNEPTAAEKRLHNLQVEKLKRYMPQSSIDDKNSTKHKSVITIGDLKVDASTADPGELIRLRNKMQFERRVVSGELMHAWDPNKNVVDFDQRVHFVKTRMPSAERCVKMIAEGLAYTEIGFFAEENLRLQRNQRLNDIVVENCMKLLLEHEKSLPTLIEVLETSDNYRYRMLKKFNSRPVPQILRCCLKEWSGVFVKRLIISTPIEQHDEFYKIRSVVVNYLQYFVDTKPGYDILCCLLDQDEDVYNWLPKAILDRKIESVCGMKFGQNLVGKVLKNCGGLDYIKIRDELLKELKLVIGSDGSKKNKQAKLQLGNSKSYGLIYKLVTDDENQGGITHRNDKSGQKGISVEILKMLMYPATQEYLKKLCQEDNVRKLVIHILKSSKQARQHFLQVMKVDMQRGHLDFAFKKGNRNTANQLIFVINVFLDEVERDLKIDNKGENDEGIVQADIDVLKSWIVKNSCENRLTSGTVGFLFTLIDQNPNKYSSMIFNELLKNNNLKISDNRQVARLLLKIKSNRNTNRISEGIQSVIMNVDNKLFRTSSEHLKLIELNMENEELKKNIEAKVIRELISLDFDNLEELIRGDQYLPILRDIDDKNGVVKCFLKLIDQEKNEMTKKWLFTRLKREVLGSFGNFGSGSGAKVDQDVELEMYRMEQEFSVVSQLRNVKIGR